MNRKLLILDDDNALRRMLTRAMEQREFTVMAAAGVQEALVIFNIKCLIMLFWI